MVRRWLILFFLAGIFSAVSAQDFFLTNIPVDHKRQGFYFSFENTNFFKDNEFESSVVKGYTLTGAWIRPKFVFVPSDKIQLELGWHYLRYNGAGSASVSVPWISARIYFARGWQFTLGDLNNSRNHRLITPVWEPERFLTDKPEAGFQVLHNADQLYFDAWLNWEQFIQQGDPFQEHLTAGVSLDYKFVNSEKFSLSLPVQILGHHHGGEIDSSPLRVQTLMNLAAGVKAKILLDGFVRQINLSGYYAGFKDSKGNAGLPFKKGNGFFSSNSLETKIGKFGLEYWNSKNFLGIKGMQLLQSVSGINSTYPESDYRKKMVSFFYDFQKEFYKGIIFGAKVEGWLEPEHHDFSNLYGLYIIVNQSFLIRQL